MPKEGKPLSADEIDILRRWIDQGALWPDEAENAPAHWAYVAPRRPEVPTPRDRAWVRNPVDAFVLDKLEKAGLRPSPPADEATLLRRVTLDLIGLPPTPDELAAFLADERVTETFRQGEKGRPVANRGDRRDRLDRARLQGRARSRLRGAAHEETGRRGGGAGNGEAAEKVPTRSRLHRHHRTSRILILC